MAFTFKMRPWHLECLGLLMLVAFAEPGCYERRLCCPGRDLNCHARNDRPFPPKKYPSPTTSNRPTFITRPTSTALPASTASRVTRRRPVESKHRALEKNTWHIHIPRDRELGFREPPELNSLLETLDDRSRRLSNLQLPENFSDNLLLEKELGSDQTTKIGDWFASTAEGVTVASADNESLILTKGPYQYKIYYGKSYDKDGKVSIEFDGDLPLIKYKIINDLLPYYIPKVGHLKLPDKCYCDEVCRSLGDCCLDYDYTCPVADCRVSEWSGWGSCEADTSEINQYDCSGVSFRSRQIVEQPRHGGRACPHLTEQKVCFVLCENELLRETALLLPYKYGNARRRDQKNEIYYGNAIEKLSPIDDYCVIFEAVWLHPACDEKEYREDLRRRNRLCVECQPTARLAKKTRCVGHGVKEKWSKWKIVNSAYCYGMWKRVEHKTPCKCDADFFTTPSFIFV